MNEFDEDQWVKGQIALDGRICTEFEALEAQYGTAEMTGTLDLWRKEHESTVTALRAQIARITHAARRKHWDDELARLGFVKPKSKAKPEAVAAAVAGLAAYDAAERADAERGDAPKNG